MLIGMPSLCSVCPPCPVQLWKLHWCYVAMPCVSILLSKSCSTTLTNCLLLLLLLFISCSTVLTNCLLLIFLLLNSCSTTLTNCQVTVFPSHKPRVMPCHVCACVCALKCVCMCVCARLCLYAPLWSLEGKHQIQDPCLYAIAAFLRVLIKYDDTRLRLWRYLKDWDWVPLIHCLCLQVSECNSAT